MRDRFLRSTVIALVLAAAIAQVSCSFSSDFVLINGSGFSAEVVYKIGNTGVDPFQVTRKPATLEATQLSSREWKELSSNDYVFDLEKRTVTLSLKPGRALRINQGGEWHEGETGTNFIIKEVDVRGTNGSISLRGDQVYKSFKPEFKPFFGPPVTLIFRYE